MATESVRASCIVIHSTAGTLVSARKKTIGEYTAAVTEAMRLVRSAEGLLRQAVTVLVDAAADKAVHAMDTATSPSRSARRRRKKKLKKEPPAADTVMDDAGLSESAAPAEAVPAAASVSLGSASCSPSHVLGPKVSRERTPPPRGAKAGTSASGSGKPAFDVDQSVVVDGLVDESELNGKIGKVTGYDLATHRYAVLLSQCGSAVKVRAEHLRLSIFNSG